MTRPLLAAVPVLLLAACASAPRPRPVITPVALPPGTWVEPRFGWQPGLTADVEIDHVRTAPGDEGTERAEVRVRSRLAVEATPGGLAVRSRDLRHEGPGQPTPNGTELLATELVTPDLRVGPAGNLLGVEARPEARSELGQALIALSNVGPVPAAFRDRILDRLDPATLRDDAEANWDRLVGFWAGASLQAGRDYVARDLVGIDLLADLPLEVEVRMRAVDLVPCEEGEAEARCVSLELSVTPDAAAASGVAPLLARLFGDRGGPPKLEYQEHSLLVTEAAGLVPHRLTTTRRVAVAFGPDRADRFERSDERTIHFRYAASDAGSPADASSAGTRSSSHRASTSR
jgi:hypothetical protein